MDAVMDRVSFCAVNCGQCKKYLARKCPGCRHKAGNQGNCKIRRCCLEKNISSCAFCPEYTEVGRCPTYDNPLWRWISMLLRLDRCGSVAMIQSEGYAALAAETEKIKKVCLKRPAKRRIK